MSNDSKMTFTAVHEGGSNEVTGVQIMLERGNEKWTSRLLSPGEFTELMLSSRIFPPTEPVDLFRRVANEGQVTKENVSVSEEQLQFLGLRRAA